MLPHLNLTMQADTLVDTNVSEFVVNSSTKQDVKAKCAFFAWARFGRRPFQLSELMEFIESHELWRDETPTNLAEAAKPDAMIIVSVEDIRKGVQSNIDRLKKKEKTFVDGNISGAFECHRERMPSFLKPFNFPDATAWLSNIMETRRLSFSSGTQPAETTEENKPAAPCVLEELNEQTKQLKVAKNSLRSIESKQNNLKRKFVQLVDIEMNVTERDEKIQEAGKAMEEILDVNSEALELIVTREKVKKNINTLIDYIRKSVQKAENELSNT